MKIINISPSRIKTAKYNPAIRTSKASLADILASITKHGIIYPLLLNSRYDLIDGHRRLACANALGFKTVPVFISNKKISKDDCYETVNSTSRKMSAKEMIFVYINGGKVSVYFRWRIAQLEILLGKEGLKTLADKHTSPLIYDVAKSICKYCNMNSDAFMKKAIWWVLRHKAQWTVKRAIESNMPKAVLKKKVLSNTSIKLDWGV